MLVGVRPLTHIIRRMLASFYLILYFRLLQMFLRCDMSFQLRREDVLAIGLFNAPLFGYMPGRLYVQARLY